ncbi:ATP-binding protein [Furfurilactobacillus milii]|uniref:ATP/GTP-binding protein n=1 Tax=Furfurilactobacillus milii TaxID=2888272 RepID=A0A6N9HZQ5_9LACO|nr:ATP-binding protein [Furfurilactobacillus milii]MYV16058.1 ATP/GTP-binding protein [Furfurilactobacillus milii]
MKFPIKYIENNLVFNQDNECFAYYELVPYNYSFLSPDQKQQVHENFRQLVAQNRDGKLHFLQLATEASIKETMERSKQLVKGSLKETAVQHIDGQVEALTELIGENQVDYRFFVGFKLLLKETEVTVKSVWNDFVLGLQDFMHTFNEQFAGDFMVMNNDEVERFMKVAHFLEDKVNRRFKIRKLDKNDFGYLMDHLYGVTGQDYDDYQYHLPQVKTKKTTRIKRYDLIKPTRAMINQKQRYLEITNGWDTTYVTYMVLSDIVGELEFPGSEIFYFQQQQFNFPIDTSLNVEIVTNKRALTKVRNKKKELRDLDNHAYESNNETSRGVSEALDSVDELEANLDQTKDAMYKISYVIRVSGKTKDEMVKRANQIMDFYDSLNIKLIRPFGDMLGLHGEFIPASKRYINDYIQYVTSDFIASLGFGATQALGEKEGIYVGYNVDTGRNVYIKPDLAAQGVKGTVTNALSAAFLGSLGGGKSFSNNLLVYYATLYGAQALILDPKSERTGWRDELDFMKDDINVVNLTSDDKNRGLLDPYQILDNLKDSESLAVDTLTFLTGISSRDAEKFPTLRKAIRNVTQGEQPGLLKVIDELRKEDTPISKHIADHIESFTDYDFATLLFSDGTSNNSISLDKNINIIQIADLVLPDADKTQDEYITVEMLSVAMLMIISTFAIDFIHSDRSRFKIVDLDEAWAFLNVAQGKTLSMKLIREGRSMNAGVYLVTQNANDLLDEKMKNNIGMKFAFRSTDINEIKHTLTFFGLDAEDEANQNRLRSLDNGECLFQDIWGHVGVLHFEYIFEHLYRAFDTRPPQAAIGGD